MPKNALVLEQKMPFDRGYYYLVLLIVILLITASTYTINAAAVETAENKNNATANKTGDVHHNKAPECSDVLAFAKNLPNVTQKQICDAVLASESCQVTDSHINYVNFIYCTLPASNWYWLLLGSVICIVWVAFLFLIEGLVSECLFCPNLEVLSKMLHLTQSIAGVTLLAFGNGSPDVFSCIAALKHPAIAQPTLVLGSLLGGGMFITCIIAGTIYRLQTFQLAKRPFIRDIVFYMAAVVWILSILYRGYIRQMEAVGFVILYISYALSVFVARFLWVKWLQRKKGFAGKLRAESEIFEHEKENRAVAEVLRPNRLSFARTESLASVRGSQRGSRQFSSPSVSRGGQRQLSAMAEQIELGLPRHGLYRCNNNNNNNSPQLHHTTVQTHQMSKPSIRIEDENGEDAREENGYDLQQLKINKPASNGVVATPILPTTLTRLSPRLGSRRPTIAFGELPQLRHADKPKKAPPTVPSSDDDGGDGLARRISHAALEHIFVPLRRVMTDVNIVAHASMSWLKALESNKKAAHKHVWHLGSGSLGGDDDDDENDDEPVMVSIDDETLAQPLPQMLLSQQHNGKIARSPTAASVEAPRVKFHLGADMSAAARQRTISGRSLNKEEEEEKEKADKLSQTCTIPTVGMKKEDSVLYHRKTSVNAKTTNEEISEQHIAERRAPGGIVSLESNAVAPTSIIKKLHDTEHDGSMTSAPRRGSSTSSAFGRATVTWRSTSPTEIVISSPSIQQVPPHIKHPHGDDDNDTEAPEEKNQDELHTPTPTPALPPWWIDIFEHIWPLSRSHWRTMRWYSRLFTIIKLPIEVILLIITPLVDIDEYEARSWCKWLQVWQLAVTPIICTIAYTGVTDQTVHGWPLCAPVAAVSCTAALFLAIFTRRERAPRGHGLFAALGFFMAISIVFQMANEVVGVLVALGLIFQLSPAFLGISLLAWGNNVPDLVSSLLLTKKGFARVAVSACYAGPLFNSMVGWGLGFAIGTAKTIDKRMYFQVDLVLKLAAFFVMGGLVMTSGVMLVRRFISWRWYGYTLYGMYATCMVVLLLAEFRVIK